MTGIPQDVALQLQLALIAGQEPRSSFFELRPLDRAGRPAVHERAFLPVGDLVGTAERILRLADGFNAYIGAAPRVREDGTAKRHRACLVPLGRPGRACRPRYAARLPAAAQPCHPLWIRGLRACVVATTAAPLAGVGASSESAPRARPRRRPRRDRRRTDPEAGRHPEPQARPAEARGLHPPRARRSHVRRDRRWSGRRSGLRPASAAAGAPCRKPIPNARGPRPHGPRGPPRQPQPRAPLGRVPCRRARPRPGRGLRGAAGSRSRGRPRRVRGPANHPQRP